MKGGCNLYIHCILKNQPQIIAVIKQFEGVLKVTNDNTFDEAVHSLSQITEEPNVIFCDEYAYGSQLDPKTRTLNKDKAILLALKEIRFNLPNARIIILLHAQRQKELAFLQNLITLSIYDFHFIDKEFTQDDLYNYVTSAPRTLKDISPYIETGNIEPAKQEDKAETKFKIKTPSNTPKINLFSKKITISKPKILTRSKKTTKKDNPAQENKPSYEEMLGSINWYTTSLSNNTETNKLSKNKIKGKIFTLGVKEEYPFIVFKTIEKLKEEIHHDKPDIILISNETPDLIETIKDLRRNRTLLDVPIIILGTEPKKELLEAGADECYLELNEETCSNIEAKKNRLSEIWKDINNEASKDQLTGLYNRNLLNQFANEQVKSFQNLNIPFSILMIDLDFFKKVNDTHGHQTGDEVLSKFAQFLKTSAREVDLVFRYGGEEFLLLLPKTNSDEALKIGERLCKEWAKLKVYNSTFSAGVAEYITKTKDMDHLIRIADKHLYHAKETGRNKVIAKIQQAEKPKENTNTGNILKEQLVNKEVQPKKEDIKKKEAPREKLKEEAKLPKEEIMITPAKTKTEPIPPQRNKVRIIGVTSFSDNKFSANLIYALNNLLAKQNIRITNIDLDNEPNIKELSSIIIKAKTDSDFLFLNLGSFKDTWWYKEGLELADNIIWSYHDDSIEPDRARVLWADRVKLYSTLKSRHKELIAFYGNVDIDLIANIFLVPTFKLSDYKEKDMQGVFQKTNKLPEKATVRVLVSGYNEDAINKKPYTFYDIVQTSEIATEWLKNHHYDEAIINPSIKGAALLEYDLKEKGIPVSYLTKRTSS